jgi:hypothetical protein
MRNWLLVAAACVAMACGGGAANRPGGARDQTPAWLAEGTGAFRSEGGKRLQGVGVASGVADPKARRRQADGAAREQLQISVDALARALAEGGAPKDRAAVSELARKAGARAAAIRDHWVTPDGDERALGVIELDGFKRALEAVDGDDRVKGELYSKVDTAFEQIAGGAR